MADRYKTQTEKKAETHRTLRAPRAVETCCAVSDAVTGVGVLVPLWPGAAGSGLRRAECTKPGPLGWPVI